MPPLQAPMHSCVSPRHVSRRAHARTPTCITPVRGGEERSRTCDARDSSPHEHCRRVAQRRLVANQKIPAQTLRRPPGRVLHTHTPKLDPLSPGEKTGDGRGSCPRTGATANLASLRMKHVGAKSGVAARLVVLAVTHTRRSLVRYSSWGRRPAPGLARARARAWAGPPASRRCELNIGANPASLRGSCSRRHAHTPKPGSSFVPGRRPATGVARACARAEGDNASVASS